MTVLVQYKDAVLGPSSETSTLMAMSKGVCCLTHFIWIREFITAKIKTRHGSPNSIWMIRSDSFSSQRCLQTPYTVWFKPHLQELAQHFSPLLLTSMLPFEHTTLKNIKFFIGPFSFSSASMFGIISSSIRDSFSGTRFFPFEGKKQRGNIRGKSKAWTTAFFRSSVSETSKKNTGKGQDNFLLPKGSSFVFSQ